MRPFLSAAVFLLCSCAHAQPAETQPADAGFVLPAEPIYFESDINELTVGFFVQQLDNANLTRPGEPVVVIIDSGGGSVSAGEVMSRAIERSKAPVTCVVDGYAASMSLYVLQSCDARVMTSRSLLMGHNPSVHGVAGNAEELAQIERIMRAMSAAMAQHITARTRISAEDYLNILEADGELWLDSASAFALGFVDVVVTRAPALR
jgi:ATP-dependent protease ClpP protease subunit